MTIADRTPQIAIAQFFDGEPPPEPELPAPQPSRTQGAIAYDFEEERRHSRRHSLEPAPRIVGQPENRMNPRPPLLLSALLTPINLALGLFSRLYGVFSYLFPFLPRLLSRLSSRLLPPLHRSPQPRPALSPHETSVRFHKEFTHHYGEHPLPLLECSYARAYDLAKSEAKFLLVVPISPEHPDNDDFVKNILLSPRVVDFLTSSHSNWLLWAGSVADSEPYQVATALQVTAFPSAVIIAHTPSVSPTAMSIVGRIPQPKDPDDFLRHIHEVQAQHATGLEQARSTTSAKDAERKLRTEQNDAYHRSLAKDRQKAEDRRAAEAAKERKAQEEKAAEERRIRYERDLKQWKRWRASTLTDQPADDAKNVVRTSIRLLDGEKVMRRFRADVAMEEVYAFVECYAELVEERTSEKGVSKPAGFEHSYGFRIVSPIPREVYSLRETRTLRQCLGQRANLIAERIEEEEEEDDDENDEEG